MRGDRPISGRIGDAQRRPPPRARGSTVLLHLGRSELGASPACAGIDPMPGRESCRTACLPRVRGDRPPIGGTMDFSGVPPPRARGSTRDLRSPHLRLPASPACAGIDPDNRAENLEWASLPRVRGDRPPRRCRRVRQEEPPPRARGSTFPTQSGAGERRASPACAGIDLRCQQQRRNCARLPRVRGDRPSPSRVFAEIGGPPPRARGSTRII